MFTVLNTVNSFLISLGLNINYIAAAAQNQPSKSIDLWILLPIAIGILLLGIFLYRMYVNRSKTINDLDDATLYDIIDAAGYSYDSDQDIFYSTIDPWQRAAGYCWAYDEACAPYGLILDFEPIYFEYDGKLWLIEFWKGQYDLCTGAEIGIYTADLSALKNPLKEKGVLFHSVSDENLLQMDFSLVRNDGRLFSRSSKHWWLTGFKVGEFSSPSELTMYLRITLADVNMRNAFVEGLEDAGYSKSEIGIYHNTVSLTFGKPHSPQPETRTPKTDELIQAKNKLLCDSYNQITGPYKTFPEKINAVHRKDPALYDQIINIGKSKKLLKKYITIGKHVFHF